MKKYLIVLFSILSLFGFSVVRAGELDRLKKENKLGVSIQSNSYLNESTDVENAFEFCNYFISDIKNRIEKQNLAVEYQYVKEKYVNILDRNHLLECSVVKDESSKEVGIYHTISNKFIRKSLDVFIVDKVDIKLENKKNISFEISYLYLNDDKEFSNMFGDRVINLLRNETFLSLYNKWLAVDDKLIKN